MSLSCSRQGAIETDFEGANLSKRGSAERRDQLLLLSSLILPNGQGQQLT